MFGAAPQGVASTTKALRQCMASWQKPYWRNAFLSRPFGRNGSWAQPAFHNIRKAIFFQPYAGCSPQGDAPRFFQGALDEQP